MNKHFEDTKYYVKRAGETAKKGLSEELEPLQERIQNLREEEEEPEPGRVEKLREDIKELQGRAEGEAKEALGEARERLDKVRNREQPAE
jgi:gas vesicle protein